MTVAIGIVPRWAGREVAITGATGFVGSHVATELVRRGARVTAIHRPSSNVSRLRAAGVNCAVAALSDEAALTAACRGAEILIHVAGAVDFGDDWQRLYEVNVKGTLTVLAAARAAGVRRVVHVSSISAVGGSNTPQELDETAAWTLGRLKVPYVTTKREAEEAALSANINGLEIVVVNPASIIGPDDFTGSEFGTLCKRFWRGRVPVYFRGGNNFVDVRDVAEGIVSAGARGRPGERYLLTGTNLTYRDFFAALGRAAGRKTAHLPLPHSLAVGLAAAGRWVTRRDRKPYITRSQVRLLGLYFYFTCDKARRELGYEPRALIETLADTYRFWNRERIAG